jgi:hypothetical protein
VCDFSDPNPFGLRPRVFTHPKSCVNSRNSITNGSSDSDNSDQTHDNPFSNAVKMGHPAGLRAGTRYAFSRDFKKKVRFNSSINIERCDTNILARE